MLPFVTRQGRDRQMRDRMPRKTGGVFAGLRGGFFEAENKADAWTSFAAVEKVNLGQAPSKEHSRPGRTAQAESPGDACTGWRDPETLSIH